jgi:hypothetical protein
MVAERIPGQLRYFAMILVRITVPVAQDDFGSNTRLELLEPALELGTLIGKEAVLERRQIDCRASGVREKVHGGCICLIRTLTRRTEHGPMHVEANAALDPAEDRRCGANLDIVGMRAEAEDGKRLV